MRAMKRVLTIAGSDCSGGAGIQADIKTISAHGVYAMSVIVSVVAENTVHVLKKQDIAPEIVRAQVDAIYEDIGTDAVKIETCKAEIWPLADVLTPNIPEAEEITGMHIETEDDMCAAAKLIYTMDCKAVLVKGGHFAGDPIDILFDGEQYISFTAKRIQTKNTHGTGCTLSSAIASNLALGYAPAEAVKRAKDYMTCAIEHALELGHGAGPTNHFYSLYQSGLPK